MLGSRAVIHAAFCTRELSFESLNGSHSLLFFSVQLIRPIGPVLVRVMLRLHHLQSLAEFFRFPAMLFKRCFQGFKLFAQIVVRLGFFRQHVFSGCQAMLQVAKLLPELITFLYTFVISAKVDCKPTLRQAHLFRASRFLLRCPILRLKCLNFRLQLL